MSERFNQLTPAEDERLSILAEECGEVIVAIMKIKRHGYASFDPTVVEGPSNRTALECEIGHLRNALRMLINAGDINEAEIVRAQTKKARGIGQWLHHQHGASDD